MAAPGAMAQMKIRMTDPQPIITGRARFAFSGFAGIDGLGLVSPGDDAAGVAVVRGTDVALSLVSPNATFGTDSDYPLVTAVGRVPVDAPIGAAFPMLLDPDALRLVSPSGVPYATEVESGQLVSRPYIAIHDVVPGSADLPAGSVVTIHGSNFQPSTEIDFDETELAQVRYVSATRIDVVLAARAVMHGMEIKARNRDGSRCTYFSYHRTLRSARSDHAVLRDVVPLFRNRTMQAATLHLSGATIGLALQNRDRLDATVVAELFTSSGVPVAATAVTVPSNRFVVRTVAELFRVRSLSSAIVRVTSATPVQLLGVSVDAAGAVTAQLPE